MLSADREVHQALTRVCGIVLPMALTAAILLFQGCQGSGPPSEGAAGGPDQRNNPSPEADATECPDPAAALDEGQTTAPGEQAATPRLTIPDDFPPTVPLLPGRRIRSLTPREDGSVSLTYSATKDLQEAADFYRQRLAGLGWEMTRDSFSGGMTTLSARQEDGSRLTVNIIENPAEQRTMIGLYHQPPLEGSRAERNEKKAANGIDNRFAAFLSASLNPSLRLGNPS